MTDLRTAAQQALEFVTSEVWGTTPYMDVRVYEEAAKLRDALRAALAEPVQEPKCKPLTEEEIDNVAAPYYGTMGFRVEAFARAIERAHGIGGNT